MATRLSGGNLIYVGGFDEGGARVRRDVPGFQGDFLGSSFSRR